MPVSIVKANYLNIESRLKKALKLINYSPKKDRIVLKPNAASPYGHYLLGDYTSPQILEALIRFYKDREIVIAEGAAVGMDFDRTFQLLGYKTLEKKYKNVSILDLNKAARREFKWKYGKLKLPEIIFTHEYINIPKMKTHQLATVTLGAKNQKGLLNEATKKKFHWIDIHDALRRLSAIAVPDLTIIDGIIAMEGNGPSSALGTPKLMGVLIAGQDMLETDNAACAAMGIAVEKVQHLPRVPVEIRGEKIQAVRKKFKMPHKENGFLKLGNVYLTCGCSGCLESFSGIPRTFLQPKNAARLPRMLRHALKNDIFGKHYILMGKHFENIPDDGRVICMGNCTRAIALEYGLPHIKGCPPSPEDILGSLLTD